MEAFPLLLAGHLGMTVRELGQRMDVDEYRRWLAFHRYVNPLGGEWRQTARIVTASLAPYCRARPPREDDFMPTEKLPMSQAEILAEFAKLKQ